MLQRALKQEAMARAAAEAEMASARMAAIRASRAAGRQALTGVNIDRFSLPHPAGSGDLLTDVSLVLSPGRRYGLIGRNGAGKSTLMRTLANYKLDGLSHLRILLVDQHVEGDDDSALQWLLRADVERVSLLEEEARLTHYLHGMGSGFDPCTLPADLNGINHLN
jgi:ATP-binding cassette subfamily F protein 3